jgi:hypothetical protein
LLSQEKLSSMDAIERVFDSTCTMIRAGVKPSGKITGLTIDTNISGWASTLAVFGEDFVTLNWGGLGFTADTYFDVALVTNHSAVPIPAAVWLFGTALIGLVGFNRQKKAA